MLEVLISKSYAPTVDASFEIIPKGFHSFSIFPFDFKKFFNL